MYRFQQKQLLQRQQLQDEEDRERRLSHGRSRPDLLSDQEKQTLQAQYQQQPAKLLNPTSYHLKEAAVRSRANSTVSGMAPGAAAQVQIKVETAHEHLDPFMAGAGMDDFYTHDPSDMGDGDSLAQSSLASSPQTLASHDVSAFLDLDGMGVDDDGLAAQHSFQLQQQQLLLTQHQQGQLHAPLFPGTGNGMDAPFAVSSQMATSHLFDPSLINPNAAVPGSINSWQNVDPTAATKSISTSAIAGRPIAISAQPQFKFSPGTSSTLAVGSSTRSQRSVNSTATVKMESDTESVNGRNGSGNDDAWLVEKRRRRRESHNAVERRRRDNINDRIAELSILVPDCNDEGQSALKPNKGVILRKSADYIRHLQEVNRKLMLQLQQHQQQSGTGGPQLPPAMPSGLVQRMPQSFSPPLPVDMPINFADTNALASSPSSMEGL